MLLGNVAQVIFVDLFAASFENYNADCKVTKLSSGPYFVLFFFSFVLTAVFGIAVAVNSCIGTVCCKKSRSSGITSETWKYTFSSTHWKLVMIGIFNAIYGLLFVYASPPNRVSPVLLPTIRQIFIPLTMVLSYFILRKPCYLASQYIGASLAFAGSSMSLISALVYKLSVSTVGFESGQIPLLLPFIIQTKSIIASFSIPFAFTSPLCLP